MKKEEFDYQIVFTYQGHGRREIIIDIKDIYALKKEEYNEIINVCINAYDEEKTADEVLLNEKKFMLDIPIFVNLITKHKGKIIKDDTIMQRIKNSDFLDGQKINDFLEGYFFN